MISKNISTAQAGRLAAGPYMAQNGGEYYACTMMYLGSNTKLFQANIEVKKVILMEHLGENLFQLVDQNFQ